MPLVNVASTSDIPLNSVIEVLVGNEPIAICNIEGTFHAMSGTCPHQGGPLGQGMVNGNSVTCPWHAWDFDCRTGENDFDSRQRVDIYPVHVETGQISVELPTPNPNA